MSGSICAVSRRFRSIPTWCVTPPSAASRSGAKRWRASRALPGVQSAGVVTPTLPFTFNFNQTEMRVDSRTYSEGQRGEIIENVSVSPGYLPTLGVPILDGRGVDETRPAGHAGRGGDQRNDGAQVLAERIGRRAHVPDRSTRRARAPSASSAWRGITSATACSKRPRRSSITRTRSGRPATSSCWRAPPATQDTLLADMRRELLAMEPGLVFMGSATMEQNMGASLMPARVGAILASAFGGLGTLLAGDRPLRRDRLLGGAPHARDRPAHGARRQARHGAVDGDAPGLHDRRDRHGRRRPAGRRRGLGAARRALRRSRRSIRSHGDWP